VQKKISRAFKSLLYIIGFIKGVIEYEQSQLDENDSDARKFIKNGDKMLRESYICLQVESHHVEFRKKDIK
jgi:hypothetical protein